MQKGGKFNEFIMEERAACEGFLKETNAYHKIPEDMEIDLDDIVKKMGSEKGWEYYKKKSDTAICYRKLAVIYKYVGYVGEEEKARKMFEFLTTIHVPKSKFDKEGELGIDLLVQTGHYQLVKGIQFNLAKRDPQKAKQLFEWAAENCVLPDEYFAGAIKYENFDHIAVGYLWRGYSLLLLGKYSEALGFLKEVVPYFNKYKKSGGEVWRKVEYFLPKALVPLCEYKLSPTDENLEKAKTGIEDYIDSLMDNKDKLEGYLYYFHLKEVFSDVYGAEKPGGKPAERSTEMKRLEKTEIPPSRYETHGKVVVFNREGGYLEELGSNNEFEAYIEKVKSLGGYPVISGLMEVYVAEGEQEPEPLIEECEKLLSRPNIDPDIIEKTRLILDVARNAEETQSTVSLYFDPEA